MEAIQSGGDEIGGSVEVAFQDVVGNDSGETAQMVLHQSQVTCDLGGTGCWA